MLRRLGLLTGVIVLCGCAKTEADPEHEDSTGGRATAGESLGGGSSGGDPASDGSGGASVPAADGLYGELHEGQYHLGPVDFAESEWHNACAPGGGYRADLQNATGLGGEWLAGVSTELAAGGGVCDACIEITTATGKTAVARVVTYGTSNAPGDLDVSPSVYAELNEDEYPRAMTWSFARCPDTGNLIYEFQTEAHQWWSSLWVRNPRVPIATVEVKSANHAEFFELQRGSDGTLTDAGGFGAGPFTLRVTAIDDQVVTQQFDGFVGGEVVQSEQQFD